ncbi:glycine cleavage system aminomethyltransferase GcvT [Ruicaihuangia caeni]|uniref:glycine cleavage system aminomethyltransferase GcvT n=1 Tax=Ruicaihuangia caeni TaxID=3042517 RepID=UPI00339049E3
MSELSRSPLHALHEAAGAQFTEFAGWSMPLRFGSELAEHRAVRETAGIFDLSHMGQLRAVGPDAGRMLDHALAGRISQLEPGRAKYTLLLAPDGGILDDLIVYAQAADDFLIVANASNRGTVSAELSQRARDFEVVVRDESEDAALIAVQGPASRAVLGAVTGLDAARLDDLRSYRAASIPFGDGELFAARTGYTGEDGFELYMPAEDAERVWTAITDAGEPLGLVRCGLAARDSLRLEAGMPLYGHELTREVLPQQAGLDRVVALDKPGGFVGDEAVRKGPPEGARVLVGLHVEGRRAARAGSPVRHGDREIGEVTSGMLSPTLGMAIALAYVDPRFAVTGTNLEVGIRSSLAAASVCELPFYRRKAAA